ncbi:MAG: hypothetical protein MAG794_01436 [Gammaproteobacteria bacterium]|nr:hypothetical protein [Gammaproteobacteria bacterium]
MQNGRKSRGRCFAATLVLGAAMLYQSSAVGVEELTVLALFKDKVLLHVDGARRMIIVGETSPEGVTLVSANSDQAVVTVDGEEEVLELGMVTNFPGASGDISSAWDTRQKLTLWAEEDGLFYASGSINDSPARFLVDTGANTIAINRTVAERLGIDYRSGKRGVATTASGVTPMYIVTLDRVSIGNITLSDVEGSVLLGEHPKIPLLGMSFLDELDMVRRGNRLELKRR